MKHRGKKKSAKVAHVSAAASSHEHEELFHPAAGGGTAAAAGPVRVRLERFGCRATQSFESLRIKIKLIFFSSFFFRAQRVRDLNTKTKRSGRVSDLVDFEKMMLTKAILDARS